MQPHRALTAEGGQHLRPQQPRGTQLGNLHEGRRTGRKHELDRRRTGRQPLHARRDRVAQLLDRVRAGLMQQIAADRIFADGSVLRNLPTAPRRIPEWRDAFQGFLVSPAVLPEPFEKLIITFNAQAKLKQPRLKLVA